MNWRTRSVFYGMATFVAFGLCTVVRAQMTSFTKAQVADRIRKVEDGVDEFRKYLDNRGEDAKSRAQSAQGSGATTRRQRTFVFGFCLGVLCFFGFEVGIFRNTGTTLLGCSSHESQ